MAANVEIKARVEDLEALARRAQNLAGTVPELLNQHDSFYRVPHGRLKLRRFSDSRAELIFYQRADSTGPKTSRYRRLAIANAEAMDAMLAAALGRAGSVKKQRRVWIVGRTRIHLDDVHGLGSFMELEVVLADGQSPDDALTEATALMQQLQVKSEHLVAAAYVDLLS